MTTTRKEHEFLVESAVLDRLKPEFKRAAELIQKVAKEGRPIILRHHADCDGYVAGIAMERAITHILSKRSRAAGWRYLRRMPSKTPYYDYIDAVKDLTNYDRDMKENNYPLLIILDSGSSEQDLMALRKVKMSNFEILIVDHHDPFMVGGKSAVAQVADLLINPHLAGGDSNLCAGMLSTELSRFVTEDWGYGEMDHLPAIAGTGDKSAGKEFDEYLALAKKKGYEHPLLLKLAKSIDFEAFHIGYLESDIVLELLSSQIERQEELTNLIITELDLRDKTIIESFKRYSKAEKMGNFQLVISKLDELLDYGSYPHSGKATGIFFDSLKGEKTILLGMSPGAITFRTNLEKFDLNAMIAEMKKRLPYVQLEGGGHRVAGTIHFIPAGREEVLGFIREYLKRM
jgi:archaea-specific RecJ-like exonuclease